MVSHSRGRAAAWAAAAILVVGAGFLFSFSLGSTWAREAPTSADEINPAISGLLCLVFAGLLLVRVGYGREHLPSAVTGLADFTVWVIVIGGLATALQSFAATYYVDGAINLIIALLAFVVARSELPSGKPGFPTATHFMDWLLHPPRLPPRRR